MLVFFDLDGDSRRRGLQVDYKANRGETPEPLRKQIPFLKELAEAMGHGRFEVSGVEADDLIGVGARRLAGEGREVLIVSADKDLAQCVGDGIEQLLPPPTANPRLGWRRLDADGVREKFGVHPAQIPDYLALVGDASDNIHGIAGVGPKTAARWLNAYGDLERVIANCGRIKPVRFQSMVHQQAERLLCNLALTTLYWECDPGPLDPVPADPDRVIEILEAMEMDRAVRDARTRYS
jgi:DNA polymerase-1